MGQSSIRVPALAAVFMVSLDATVAVAAFPALRSHFAGATPADLSWVLNGYTIVYAALLVPAGRLADRRGARRIFLLGLALFTLASAGCALAGNVFALSAARVVQAVGAALLAPASLALLLAAFPGGQRQGAVGLWSAVGAGAAALGPSFGSALIQWASWPMIFLLNVPLGIAALWLTWRDYPEPASEDGGEGTGASAPAGAGFDGMGTLLLIVGVGALAGGLVRAGDVGWAAPVTAGTLGAGAAALAILARRARSQKSPTADDGVFGDPGRLRASAATLVFGAAFGAGFLAFYLFMTGVWGFAQGTAGLAATPGPVVVIALALGSAGLTARFGLRRLLVAGGLLFAASNLWFFLRLGTVADYLGAWLPGQLASGVAIGLLLPALTGAALAGLKPARYAEGNAVNSTLRQLGGALGVALVLALAGKTGAGVADFRVIYALLAGAGVVIAALAPAEPPGAATGWAVR